METIEAASIKLWLNAGPKRPSSDEPLFRLVWSTEQFEIRKGVVQYYVGNKRISEGEEMGRFPKYRWLKDRWILEMWCGPEVTRTEEVPDSANGSYEPIYVFESAAGNPLPLNLAVVQLVVRVALRPKSGELAIRTRLADELLDKEKKLDRYTEDAIDTSDTQSLLHHGEAIIVPATYDVTSPNLRNKK